MARRKTFNVMDFKNKINGILLKPSISQEEKRGMCCILEAILHDTGNYQGYGWSIGCHPYNYSTTGERSPNPGHQEYSRYYY